MAYTNSPQVSTYRTEEIQFAALPEYRTGIVSAGRDSQVVNMYYDLSEVKSKMTLPRLKKRPGLTASSYSLTKVSANDPVRGYFYDVDQNAFYWVVLDKMYVVKPDVGTSVRTVATLNTSTGYVGFCSYLKSDNTRYVCAADGTDLWLDNYAITTCTRVTDVDFPSPHKPHPVYIDGYIFLISDDTGDIYNSAVDDPFSWVPGDFITAEMSSDYALRILRQKNYVVCMGYNSIEYFYDAGIASGSPLQRNPSAYSSIGYLTGFCQIGDSTYFIGRDANKNNGVYVINDFKVDKISNSVVDRTIQSFSTTSNAKSPLNLDKDGFCISIDGRNFYAFVTTDTTWLYDIDTKIWIEWVNSGNTELSIEAVWGMYNGSVYVAITGQTTISILTSATYQDFGTNFTCKYTTEPMNFGSSNWKFAHRLYLYGSQHLATGTSSIAVTWSDDDWVNETAARNINIFSASPFISRLGKFRRRSWRFKYTDNYPLWLTGASLDLNIGQV